MHINNKNSHTNSLFVTIFYSKMNLTNIRKGLFVKNVLKNEIHHNFKVNFKKQSPNAVSKNSPH